MLNRLIKSLRNLSSSSPEPLPNGWSRHDGSGCPFLAIDCPAVMLRNGSVTPAGHIGAEAWGSHWHWLRGSSDPADIVAYCLEPGVVQAHRPG